MRRLVVCIMAVLFLMSFGVPSVSAKKYEILSLAAIGNDPYAHSSYYVDVTPVYCTDVVDDVENGILRFKVLQHPMNYMSLLAASTNISDASKLINGLPILNFLEEGDTVEINFKDCQYTQKSIEKISTNNYKIRYVGQANSATVNTIAIPEFPKTLNSTIFVALILTLVASARKIKRKCLVTSQPTKTLAMQKKKMDIRISVCTF